MRHRIDGLSSSKYQVPRRSKIHEVLANCPTRTNDLEQRRPLYGKRMTTAVNLNWTSAKTNLSIMFVIVCSRSRMTVCQHKTLPTKSLTILVDVFDKTSKPAPQPSKKAIAFKTGFLFLRGATDKNRVDKTPNAASAATTTRTYQIISSTKREQNDLRSYKDHQDSPFCSVT